MSLKDKVIELLREADSDVRNDFFHAEISDNITWDSEEMSDFRKAASDQGINFEHVDRYGGEGEGEEYWSVYSFSDGQEVVFIKFDGTYASYYGSEFDEFYEVQAVERLVTFYERKKA